jgi:nitronate monooxygenase
VSIVPSELPIIQAPMAGGPSTPELAAACSAAGAFGYVAGGYLDAAGLTEALRRTRELTGGPLGVNLFLPSPAPGDPAAIEAYADALAPLAARFSAQLGEPRFDDDAFADKVDVLEGADVHTVSFTFGCPARDVVNRLQRKGIMVAVTVTSPDEAQLALDAGTDYLIVQGTEAGGHQAVFDSAAPNRTPLLDAVAAIAAVTDRPLVAAGGISTPAAVRTALGAGAVAVQVGTALLCTPEAGTSAVYRDALLTHRYPDTVITRAFSGRWARGLANRFALDHPDAPDAYPQIHHLTRPLRAAATKAGDPDVPNLWAGTGWHDVAAEDARSVIGRLAAGL